MINATTATNEQNRHLGALTRADLHVHTNASSGSATGWLQALGVAESYSEPEEVHDLAKARGMDLVAITDHDTIEGALRLVERGFTDVIVGEEVTTRFSDTGCLLHVLVWRITPELHEAIASLGLREDAVGLAHWLREQRLPHALAHPLFDMNRKLCAHELERCASLFGGFEIMNGGHTTAAHRTALQAFLAKLDAGDGSDGAALRLWPRRWLTAGSDDHGLLNIGRAWTGVEGAVDAATFFERITQGGGMVGGRDATTESLAHQFICVASRHLERAGADDRSAVRLTRSFFNALQPMREVFACARRGGVREEHRHADLLTTSRAACAQAAEASPRSAEEYARLLDDPIAAWGAGQTIASLVASQTAYVVAAAQHQRERDLLQSLASSRRSHRGLNICLFVDALHHLSGVSRFVLDLARCAQERGAALTLFTCADAHTAPNVVWPSNVRVVEAIATTSAPGYPGVRLGVPWAADLIQLCAAEEPDVIHVSTPGPVGWIGVLCARILGAPLVGTHHTDFPAYAKRLFQSPLASLLSREALRRWLGQFDCVLARSRYSAGQLQEMGLPSDTVRCLTPGVNRARFNRRRRDPSIWRRFPGVGAPSVKGLYVGRLSPEKNLDLLCAAWRRARERLLARQIDAELIIVGDGPSRDELQSKIDRAGAHILGALRGGALAQIYASADFFIFPSATETLGQVVLEAQASGMPALVSDEGGPCEIVLDCRTGRLLPAHDIKAWSDAIIELASDEALRRTMGRAAALHAQWFDFDATFESFWQAHEAVANAGTTTEHAGDVRTRDVTEWPASVIPTASV